jgi:carbamoyltransferase
MYTLGIYDGHNAGCSLIDGNNILFSIEEERFSRIKGHDGRLEQHGLPVQSLTLILKSFDKKYKISKIALALKDSLGLRSLSLLHWAKAVKDSKDYNIVDFYTKPNIKKQKNLGLDQNQYLDISFYTQQKRIDRLLKLLKDFGLSKCDIEFVPHHLAHHASSWYTSNKKTGLAISLDGRGDALSGMVSVCHKNKIKPIHEISSFNSIGHFYSAVTVALGFKAVRHEGKITGLAAYGSADKKLLKKFNNLIWFNSSAGSIFSLLFTGGEYGPYPWANFKLYVDKIKNEVISYPREVIAATAQLHLENVVKKFVSYWVAKTGLKDVHLSGGVFANVKLNQKISNIKKIKSLVVHPGMSDCGISLGAALFVNGKKPNKMQSNYYLGISRSSQIKKIISLNKINAIKPKDISDVIANALAEKKIIARYCDTSEYGPRALGNRSILFHAGDPKVNDFLNKKLSRTEFMPFAPVTIDEDVNKSYIIPKNIDIKESMKYMTITVNCTSYMKKNCPAVVHVDGTARPQIIYPHQNFAYYKILKKYKELTGVGSLVNTSFNMHEEPIVESPKDALRAFILSGLDILILGEYIIHKKDLIHLKKTWC